MDSILELDKVINLGFSEFKKYIDEQLKKQSDFLEHFFWTTEASQMTVLNYLIHLYPESKNTDTEVADVETNPTLPMIKHVLSLMDDKNIGTPLHQALDEGKTQLALDLLELVPPVEQLHVPTSLKRNKKALSVFNVDQRDQSGRTLLYLVIACKNEHLLEEFLKREPNVHVPTSQGGLSLQPIHQAVELNSPEAIRLLSAEKVQLANFCGASQDTPLLLAAHLGHVDALEALLEQPAEQLLLEQKRKASVDGKLPEQTAIERLCDHYRAGKNKDDALRGIAMLLCRGAEPPRNEAMRQLLNNNRSALLKAIDAYLKDKPELVDPFVRRCHLRESALHNIVYAHHSWGNAIRHLFGLPSDVGRRIENLVVRKYTTTSDEKEVLTPSAGANLSAEKDPVKLYSMFVKRYTEAYNNQFFTNSWSKMRWMIADGQCDWDTVRQYAVTNPHTRSARIYNEMFKSLPKFQEDLPSVETDINSTNLSL